jgi:hypothetical protein
MSPDKDDAKGEQDFRLLSEPERAVIAKLLSGEFPGRTSLLEQMVDVKAREIDGHGSLALAPVDHVPPAEVKDRVPVEAELEDDDGVTIHVSLHVVNGQMDELEVYREDSGPIERQLLPDDFRLIVF